MSTQRKQLRFRGHYYGYIDGYHSHYDLDKTFHPDFSLTPYDLKWNNGAGYPMTKCLNANGNQAFDNKTSVDCYFAVGSPGQSEFLAATLASALSTYKLGIVVGKEYQRNWIYLSDTSSSNHDRYTDVTETDFTEYDRNISVNNPLWGRVGRKSSPTDTSASFKATSASFDFKPDNVTNGRVFTAEKNGAKFLGFSRFGEMASGDFSGVYEDVTAVAVFGLPFMVAFNANGGSGSMGSVKYYHGVDNYLPQELSQNSFTRIGYTFAGWSLDKDALSASFQDGSSADDVYNAARASANATVTIYAVWTPKSSSVTLNQRNATTQGTASVTATYDSDLPQVTVPLRMGYTFEGYYSGQDGSGTKYYNADGEGVRTWNRTEQSITLYANWLRITHRVTITNTDPAHCRLTAKCSDPALNVAESGGVLAFDAAELANYVITATYATAFDARKYALQGFRSGTTTYAVSSPTGLTRQYVYTGGPSAPTAFQTVFQIAQQFDVGIEVSCRVGAPPVILLLPEKDSADGWFAQNLHIGIDYGGNDAVEFETWSVTRDGSPQPYDSYNPADPDPMVFTIDANTTLRVAFKVKTCEATVGVQSASAAVVGSNVATVTVDQYTTGQTHWGDVANYSAQTTGLPADVEFDGWYKENGSPADDVTADGVAYTFRDANYRIVLAGDVKLYAAYRAKVSLRAQAMPDSEAHGSVGIDGAYQDNETFAHVRLGTTCSIGVRTDSFFGGWFEGANPSYTTEIPLAYAQEDEIRVTGARTLTVFLLDDEEFNYIALYSFDARAGHENWDPTLGAWSLTGNQSGFEEVTKAQYEAAITEWHGGTAYTAPSNGRFFKVSGIKRANLRVQSAGSLGLANIRRYHVDDLTEILEQSDANAMTAVINDHYVFVANWGVPARRTITATRANGSERTFGDISIEGGTEAGDGSWSVEAEQNVYVTLVAVPRNGYKFVGWFAGYDHAGAPESADREFRLKVQSTATYYAMFAQDANAIYEWEGGAVSKRLEWRSKMFVASRPFNPVALRVDALGYPVECEVGVFSSPEAEAVRKGKVSPASQMARRLPLLRPERYVQVTVRADREVDRVIVGTSMEGLNV